MPIPPDIDEISEINFVTQALLAGCHPSDGLIFELAKEPLKDLALLLFLPDAFDIGQAIFDPRRGRKRRPGRKGRKSRRGFGFPDVSDLIGDKIRSFANPQTVTRIGFKRFFWAGLNAYEAANFAVAIVEGVTDVGFESLHGYFLLRPNECMEFARKSRSVPYPHALIAGPNNPVPISMVTQDFNVGFFPSGINASTNVGDFQVAVTIECRSIDFFPESTGRIILTNQTRS